MGWIRWTGKALELAGKIAQADSFEKWAEKQGQAIIEKLAVQQGGSLFKSAESKAKSDIWADLAAQFKNNEIFEAGMKKAIGGYTERLSSYIGSQSYKLPYPSSSNIRVVPFFIVNLNERRFWQSFDSSKELANLKGGPELRAYFFDEMTEQLGGAFSAAALAARPDDPIQLEHDRWIIGADQSYEWSGKKGHYYEFSYYSDTSPTAKGKNRKEAVERAKTELEMCKQWLFNLKDTERQKLGNNLPE